MGSTRGVGGCFLGISCPLLRTSPPHPSKRQCEHGEREWNRAGQVNPALPRDLESTIGHIEVEIEESHAEDGLEEEVRLAVNSI